MANQNFTTEEALAELASLGRRIAELTSLFEGGRHPSAPAALGPGAADRAGDETLPAKGGMEAAAQPAHAGGVAQRRPGLPRPAQHAHGGGKPRRRGGSQAAGSLPAAPRVTVQIPRKAGASSVVEPDRDRGDGGRPRLRWPWLTAPMLLSSLLHVAALVFMALMLLPRERPPERTAIVWQAAEDETGEEVADVDLQPVDLQPAEPESPLDSDNEPLPADTDPVAIDPDPAGADQAATPMEQPVLGGDDLLGGGVNAGDLLAAIGEDGDGDAGGDTGTGGEGGGRFFGRQGVGRTALFLCDNSNSYAVGGFQTVLIELSRAVGRMKPEQSFHVVFFSDTAYKLLHPQGVDTFLPATPENKRKLDAWLPTVELCSGGRGIRGAGALAVALKPDVVYFLSDGDHADSVIDRMVGLPLDGTVVHTFGMQADVRDRRTGLPDPERVQEQQRCNDNLVRIAEAHRGTFTPVFISPQAVMAAATRPVKKNRTRGAVWGITLEEAKP
jgi:hypothetical protein